MTTGYFLTSYHTGENYELQAYHQRNTLPLVCLPSPPTDGTSSRDAELAPSPTLRSPPRACVQPNRALQQSGAGRSWQRCFPPTARARGSRSTVLRAAADRLRNPSSLLAAAGALRQHRRPALPTVPAVSDSHAAVCYAMNAVREGIVTSVTHSPPRTNYTVYSPRPQEAALLLKRCQTRYFFQLTIT